jgi:phage terminase large subunit-like protein
VINVAKQYIEDVLSGKVVVGQKARKAVQRHVNDLTIAEQKGWFFCEKTAEIWLRYISSLRHTKGKWARKPFTLQPWQCFMIYATHGWLMKDTGFRRFRKAYVRVPRKNGKSELSAAVATGHLLIDDEQGGECYCAATNLTQAKMVYTPAAVMMKMACQESRSLAKKMTISRSVNNPKITVDDDGIESVLMPLTKNPEGNEGSNPSFATIDEYHLHQDNEQVGIIETGMGTRDNPMIWIITTAGFDISYPCYEYEQKAVNALDGVPEFDRTFVLIYDLDDGDDWKDPANWAKANPGLAYGTPSLEYLHEQYNKSKVEGISAERAFRVKHLNQWWNESMGWITDEVWMLGSERFDPEQFAGRECFVGLDLAANKDLTALCVIVPPENHDEKVVVFWKYYCPDEQVQNPLCNEGQIVYRQWAKDGWLTVTDGNVVDYNVIEADILRINEVMPIKRMGYDIARRFGLISNLTNALGEEIIVAIAQTCRSLNVPMVQTERLAMAGMLQHGGNPVSRWMLGNVAIMINSNEEIKLDRKKKKGKIDGIAAMVDAMYVYMNEDFQHEQITIHDLIAAKNFKDKDK